jgi:NADH dehydrogenase
VILVTGGSGFVGRSVAQRLQSEAIPFKLYRGRINDPLSIRAELLDVETVIHLAGSEAKGSVRQLHHVDVDGTERLLEECRRMTVRHLIVISRLGADPHSIYPLLRAKGDVERLARRSGIPTTIIRSATLFGRDDRFMNVIAALAAWSWPFVLYPARGEVAMQPLWVEDLARCIVAASQRPGLSGRTIEVAGEERMRYREIATEAIIAARLGRRIPVSPGMLFVRPLTALLFGWRIEPPVNRFFLDRFTTPDITAIDSVRRQFGFHPARLGEHLSYLRRAGLRWTLLMRRSRA